MKLAELWLRCNATGPVSRWSPTTQAQATQAASEFEVQTSLHPTPAASPHRLPRRRPPLRLSSRRRRRSALSRRGTKPVEIRPGTSRIRSVPPFLSASAVVSNLQSSLAPSRGVPVFREAALLRVIEFEFSPLSLAVYVACGFVRAVVPYLGCCVFKIRPCHRERERLLFANFGGLPATEHIWQPFGTWKILVCFIDKVPLCYGKLLLSLVSGFASCVILISVLPCGTSQSSVYFSSFYLLPWAGDHRTEDQHQQNKQKQAEPEDQREASVTSSGSQTMVGTPSADYVTAYAPHDMGHAMGQFAYPNVDPYYGSLYAAYGGQPMVSS
ncbi:hypothetical protein PR202_ga11860 [Eleusine coracana subsp. coracana]|uniref:Uncharacterized protein n=1 Tax=Eleusine coracana subsp. coracana TaxID=191504 RepID=A0AAV5CA37_ELECO|nr:hypothetical protein PR202_ga11860 [Eleusine coracana subsp. coracana]